MDNVQNCDKYRKSNAYDLRERILPMDCMNTSYLRCRNRSCVTAAVNKFKRH
jgi:hypothetical protein